MTRDEFESFRDEWVGYVRDAGPIVVERLAGMVWAANGGLLQRLGRMPSQSYHQALPSILENLQGGPDRRAFVRDLQPWERELYNTMVGAWCGPPPGRGKERSES